MPVSRRPVPVQAKLDALRTEFADLAFNLERKGRRDAADVVMMLDTRVREMMEEIATAGAGEEGDAMVTVGRALCPTNNRRMSEVIPDLPSPHPGRKSPP